jgi:uncharacterized protein YoxC
MEATLPMALQVALYTASGAIVVVAVILIRVSLRLGQQLDRAVTAMERVEGELVPLAREIRAAVDRLRTFSEHTADAVGGMLLPVRTVNRALGILQTGVATFVKSFWNGPTASRFHDAPAETPHNGDPTS